MIRNFRHKGLETFFLTGNTKGINAAHAKRLAVRLDAMRLASTLSDLDRPGWSLHELKGQRKGTWSIHISGPWCLTFEFEEPDCVDIDYEQYH